MEGIVEEVTILGDPAITYEYTKGSGLYLKLAQWMAVTLSAECDNLHTEAAVKVTRATNEPTTTTRAPDDQSSGLIADLLRPI